MRWVLAVSLLLLMPAGLAVVGPLANDAGSGHDAAGDPSTDIDVVPGIVYEGDLATVVVDDSDWYAFTAVAGSEVQVWSVGLALCGEVRTEDGPVPTASCGLTSRRPGVTMLSATMPSSGRAYITFGSLVPAHYRFSFAADAEPVDPGFGEVPTVVPPAPGNDPSCPGAPTGEASATSGAGDALLPSLTWATLKTGFRALIAWEGSPMPAKVVFYVNGGPLATAQSPATGAAHAVFLHSLPIGGLLCFQVRDLADNALSGWHALRLNNAMNAFAGGAYTMNFAVLVNEGVPARARLDDALELFAHKLWDATDGWVRVGRVIVLVGDYQHHHAAYGPTPFTVGGCGPAGNTLLPGCYIGADYIFTFHHYPVAAGATTRDGIASAGAFIEMNNLHEGVLGDANEVALVMAHELGHYAFGALDLYTSNGVTGGPDCWNSVQRISIMGSNRAATEFDDEVVRCPNEFAIGGYIPTWTLLRERFTNIPDRAGPSLNTPGDGGAFAASTFVFTPTASTPAAPEDDDAGSGRDAPESPAPEVVVEPGSVYEGRMLGTGVDYDDWYAFDAAAGQTVALRVFGVATCPGIYSGGGFVDAACAYDVDGSVVVTGTVSAAGWSYLEINTVTFAAYRFGFGLDGPAPDVSPAP